MSCDSSKFLHNFKEVVDNYGVAWMEDKQYPSDDIDRSGTEYRLGLIVIYEIPTLKYCTVCVVLISPRHNFHLTL